MSSATMSVRLEPEVKKSLEQLCSEMGMPVSTALNVCAKAMIRSWGFPFAVKGDIPNEETAQSMRDTLEGKNLSRTFDSVDEMWEDLNA
ncbi:type II toxin-antitoxin system RelB/DinJ family antitoxin [Selenomonas sp.]|uniref:type II toxin-antitoxin system RelB/DinJ family antitoxin n=1 Tax=Selenomonas sp. TaxID=2053611 RepID=UPI0025E494BF|nr:type II toxin-antitoxin system RelB/DinJ family antitoxin [Selenomonas sp.]MBQ1866698.1 type II toxin-antitoxin system RelB/DinJ family antitoxin [Selenomonas sp.]MDD6120090.1 type II toxin-antitoxin system RelB/DinJ family antitoxin [Selenomonadaceae bacterium]MDD7055797.1 type II toxin-antitoxin system RelB/DinJ family antitoxin [Selenomonadaceae bacterium]MDY3915472.1 type II toxin-antitoxin system RelB/DinJ family antitoxin [Selenomonadaceae bacterium]